MNKKRIDLDCIRSIAIVFVICIHGLSYIGFYQIKEQSAILYIMHIARCIFITCVPLFLLLTGYLNGLKDVEINWNKINKKIIKLVLIYLLVGSICSIPKLYQGDFYGVLISMFTFEAAPYGWYLGMYLGLYLLIPVLNMTYYAVKNRGGGYIKYLIIVLAIVVILPSITNNFDFDSNRWWDGSEKKYTPLLPNYWNQLYPVMYYFIGICLKDFNEKFSSLNRKLIGCLIILFSILFGTINYIKNIDSFFSWDWGTSYGGYQSVIISVLIFIFFLNIKDYQKCIEKSIRLIAKYSFGMYLISWLFDVCWYKLLFLLDFSLKTKLLIMPLSVLIIVLCSLLFSVFITKIAERIITGFKV